MPPFGFDAAGNLIAQVDAWEWAVNFYYDLLYREVLTWGRSPTGSRRR